MEIPRRDCERRTVDEKPNAALAARGPSWVIPRVARSVTSQPSWRRVETTRKIQLHIEWHDRASRFAPSEKRVNSE